MTRQIRCLGATEHSPDHAWRSRGIHQSARGLGTHQEPGTRTRRHVMGLTPSSQTLTCTMASASTVLMRSASDLCERLMPTDYRFGIAGPLLPPTTSYALLVAVLPLLLGHWIYALSPE